MGPGVMGNQGREGNGGLECSEPGVITPPHLSATDRTHCHHCQATSTNDPCQYFFPLSAYVPEEKKGKSYSSSRL